MDIREKILAASDVKTKEVRVSGVKVEVRGLTGAERDKLYDMSRVGDKIDSGLLQYNTVILATYDPATGNKVFNADDIDILKGKSAELTTVLYGEISKLSGLGPEEAETAEKNSLSSTPSVDSTSLSQKNSE